MDNPGEILRLCRLCLVKDQVNIPIFEEQGDIRQIFLKISSCLPVKVSRDDQLPKKICDGCLNKLDLLYEFWNTSVNAEKTLLSWLGQAGVKDADEKISAVAQQIAKSAETQVKQEALEDGHAPEVQSFEEEAKDESEAPPPKRARRTAAVKAQINITPESDDDDDMDSAEAMTKVEDETDESDGEDKDPSYGEVPGTSADDQAGPSGVGKDGVEAPFSEEVIIQDDEMFEIDDSMDDEPVEQYQCGICSKIFSSKKDFIEQHINTYAKKLTCCKCIQIFENSDDLYDHHETHKDDESYGVVYQEESQEGEELIFMNEGEEILEIQEPVSDDLLYILDDTDQNYVNEVVVQGDQLVQVPARKQVRKNSQAAQLVSLEHGYMLPDPLKDSEGKVVLAKRLSLPTTSTSIKTPYSPPKPRTPQLKRRHEVPDFSATNYILIEPNEELDSTHFKCQRCEQLFINKFGFFRHIEKGKCYVNNCDVCSGTFTSNSDFYAHYVAEHTDRAICNFCFRTFMYEKNVKEHMLRHLDQFRHRCEECNKGFYTVREYRNHYKNRHMGIRHKCEVCGRSFADEYYFRKHIATHAKATSNIVLEIQN